MLGAIEAFIIETPNAVMDTYMASPSEQAGDNRAFNKKDIITEGVSDTKKNTNDGSGTLFKVASDYATGKIELPKSHNEFIKNGWKDITDSRQVASGNLAREYSKNGVRIVYEDGAPGKNGFKGIDHYHIINPNSTNNYDLYLDQYGNPVPKNSKQSHILKKK